MADISSFGSNFGASVDTGEITDGSVTEAKLETALQTQWRLLETLNPSGVASITSGTLTACSVYKVDFQDMTADASNSNLLLRFNGDTGVNYDHTYISAGAVVTGGGATSMLIGSLSSTGLTFRNCGQLIINGKTKTIASGRINVAGIVGDVRANGLVGSWIGGSAVQVSTMTFLAGAGNMTGKIRIYGKV